MGSFKKEFHFELQDVGAEADADMAFKVVHKIRNIRFRRWVKKIIESTRLPCYELASTFNHLGNLRLVDRAAETLNHNIATPTLLEDAHAGSSGFIFGFIDKHGTKIRRVTQITNTPIANTLKIRH